MPTLSINFDTVINFTGYQNYRVDTMTGKVSLDQRTTARLGPGIEWVVASKVPLRAGVVYDSGLPATYLTVGLGYLSTVVRRSTSAIAPRSRAESRISSCSASASSSTSMQARAGGNSRRAGWSKLAWAVDPRRSP